MRIIAGAGRGRRILSVPKALPVRPISDRMKQSLFDIIRPRIMGSRFLDLFAGTGAVGLEALSRGAEQVVFVDGDKRCVEVIERNLERVEWGRKAKVFRANLLEPLSWIPYRSGIERFDLIFMGPPYKDESRRPIEVVHRLLEHVVAAGLLEPTGWIIAQHHKNEKPGVPDGLEHFRDSKYGDTVISFYRELRVLRPE